MKNAAQPGVRVGTAVTAIIAVLPWLSDFFITAYVLGALAGVWFAVRWQDQEVTFKEGARIGYLSGFYGLLAASGIYDLVWQLLHYPLWEIANAERLLTFCAGLVGDMFHLSFWLLLTLQILVVAICAGAFAAPAGILGVKLFRPGRPAAKDI